MSRLVDRLRGIVAETAAKANKPTAQPLERPIELSGADEISCETSDAAGALGGTWEEDAGQRFLIVDRTYRPGHRHGDWTLADYVLPQHGPWRDVLIHRPEIHRPENCPEAATSAQTSDGAGRTLFIDLETTGLAGGAGTYAFLVGCGWFDGGVFRVRQFFLSSFTAEAALLRALSTLAADTHTVVSYNGKTFDLPLIETRYLFNRMQTPFGDLPHLDMLHPARRLWRIDADDEGTSAGCRLGSIEQVVCGHTREGDVPGFEIPSRYFHYIRSGDARPLEPVLEHNRLDLLSLALLTAHAAQMVDEGAAVVRTAREAVGLGRLFERAGRLRQARSCFARACGLDDARLLPGDGSTRADALRGYAHVCRRERRFADAAIAWARLVELEHCPPHIYREAAEALAVYHEHRLRDPHSARAFAVRSLPLQSTPTRVQAIQHRLARLDRKIVTRGPESMPLF